MQDYLSPVKQNAKEDYAVIVIGTLISEKSRLYDKVYEMKKEMQEAETVQKCVEQAIQTEQTRVQAKRRNMEL